MDFVEVEFKGYRLEFYKNPQQFPFKVGDYVIVQAEKGIDLGRIHHTCIKAPCVKDKEQLLEVIRKAEKEEVRRLKKLRKKEEKALMKCKELAVKRGLNMKLIDSEYQFDGNKLTFFFTADKRVDFRELVKDLAAEYKTRIELRQIGIRDEAKRVSGCGICGYKLCCTAFLREFEPISSQYAKEQNLSINPSKLSGCCGRLMCCLLYEKDLYEESLKKFPPMDSIIKTSKGAGKVEKIDIFKDIIYLRYENDEWDRITLEEAKELMKNEPECVEEKTEIDEENQ
ncbi:hypothetical protein DRQ09_00870 [candidate division KSB1 bacterium]|nr:MAG: hypothetical protein DRQ09_00870 [candidate division KSB1 bacterium]